MRTRAGAETLHFSVNDRNDIKRDPSPPPVHTRSTDSHLPTPHQTHEGVQHPNLAVSTRGAIRLITLTFLSLRVHTRRTLAPRGQRTRVRVRRHSPLSPSLPRPLHSPLLSPHDPFKLICPFYSLLLPLSSRRRTAQQWTETISCLPGCIPNVSLSHLRNTARTMPSSPSFALRTPNRQTMPTFGPLAYCQVSLLSFPGLSPGQTVNTDPFKLHSRRCCSRTKPFHPQCHSHSR